MSDLPIPVPQSTQNIPSARPEPAGPVTSNQPNFNMSSGVSDDPKDLLTRATAQVESTVIATPTTPAQRATGIQAIKAAYIKARYNIDVSKQ